MDSPARTVFVAPSGQRTTPRGAEEVCRLGMLGKSAGGCGTGKPMLEKAIPYAMARTVTP
jgi:hypothetical protein